MALEFCDLPEELKIEVFKKLDGKSLKDAALVCSEWNRLMSTTPAIMKKFILRIGPDVLSPDETAKFMELMSLKRNFNAAAIRIEGNFAESRLLEVVQRYGRRLTRINLDSAVFIHPEKMLELLEQMPELEELTLICSQPTRRANLLVVDDSMGSVTLRKLKKLLVDRYWHAFQLIEAPAIVDLDTSFANINQFTQRFAKVESFLKASPKLESLKINVLSLFGIMDPNFPFQLKTIISSNFPFHFDENIRKFFLSQAASVETLVLTCKDSEFYETVLTEFKRLRNLKCPLHYLTPSEEFYQSLKPMPLLTKIDSFYGFSSIAATQAVLGNCPNLVKLECLYYEELANYLDFVAYHNRNLKVLAIRTIRATVAKFQRLKTLTLYEVEDSEHLIVFLKAHPTIRTLSIERLVDNRLSNDSLDVLMNETKLKHVTIGADESVLDGVYNKIKGGYGCWKTLELRSRGGIKYKFELPENPADWNPSPKLSGNETSPNF